MGGGGGGKNSGGGKRGNPGSDCASPFGSHSCINSASTKKERGGKEPKEDVHSVTLSSISSKSTIAREGGSKKKRKGEERDGSDVVLHPLVEIPGVGRKKKERKSGWHATGLPTVHEKNERKKKSVDRPEVRPHRSGGQPEKEGKEKNDRKKEGGGEEEKGNMPDAPSFYFFWHPLFRSAQSRGESIEKKKGEKGITFPSYPLLLPFLIINCRSPVLAKEEGGEKKKEGETSFQRRPQH